MTGSDFWSDGFAGGGKCTYTFGAMGYGGNDQYSGGAGTDVRCG